MFSSVVKVPLAFGEVAEVVILSSAATDEMVSGVRDEILLVRMVTGLDPIIGQVNGHKWRRWN